MDPEITELKEDELNEELKGLSSWRGVDAANIVNRVGPALRLVCGIAPDEGPKPTRDRLINTLRELVDELPQDLQLLTAAAFGIREDLRAPTLTERLDKFAATVPEEHRREQRTLKRKIRAGRLLIAQNAVERARSRHPSPASETPAREPVPWHTAELRVSVALHLPVPEVFETRRIVADQDGLETVELAVSLTPPAGLNGGGSLHDLGLDLLYGGEITKRILKSPNRIGFVLRLPKPLHRGEEHEYAFRVRLPQDRPIGPYYVCTPSYPCDRFRLHVRFGRDSVPASIWRLQETWPTDVGESWETREQVTHDSCREVCAEFVNLAPRLSYGFAWSQDVSAAGDGGG